MDVPDTKKSRQIRKIFRTFNNRQATKKSGDRAAPNVGNLMLFQLGELSGKTGRLKELSDKISRKMVMNQPHDDEMKEIFSLISDIHQCMSRIKEEVT